ncbi:MAG: 2-oxoglutarate ferredoxin oxidoreductase subunit alpha, partial [Candidatus Omnitrophica bacterium]|nr:2-oxoglutarate ferredoxin oxidoreductase subunit alpha [Candidatus Omnitrophota bacterium]
LAVKAGYNYADITETFAVQTEVVSAPIKPGTYRKITGNQGLAIGLIAGANMAKKTLMYGSYPITPASDILHELAKHKNYGVKTYQAEDEIAAIGFAIGSSFAGQLGITGTSGPGMCLKSEMMGLAIVSELPLVIVNVQRGGPSTGLPTKTEQSDLLQAMYGRNGESPLCVLAPKTPADCFGMAVEAVRLAVKFMTPVILLSDGNIANGSEPWLLPDIEKLEDIPVSHPAPRDNGEPFLPFARNTETLAREWGIPGIKGLEHRNGGLAKADVTGHVSYDPDNNQKMNELRRDKIRRIAQYVPDAEVVGPESGPLLILGWGSPYGSIFESLTQLKKEGLDNIAHVHLNYINPFPKNLGEILKHYSKVLIPELNFGQLLTLIRQQFPGVNCEGFNKVKGQPFKVFEIKDKIREVLAK